MCAPEPILPTDRSPPWDGCRAHTSEADKKAPGHAQTPGKDWHGAARAPFGGEVRRYQNAAARVVFAMAAYLGLE